MTRHPLLPSKGILRWRYTNGVWLTMQVALQNSSQARELRARLDEAELACTVNDGIQRSDC